MKIQGFGSEFRQKGQVWADCEKQGGSINTFQQIHKDGQIYQLSWKNKSVENSFQSWNNNILSQHHTPEGSYGAFDRW